MNTPKNVIDNFVNVGIAKAQLRGGKLMLLSMMAGVYIAIGGVLSVVAGFGFPELTAGNPSLQRLLSGAAFPIGLILVVILGAELFTNWVAVYLGNFMGALLFTMLFVYAVGLTAAEPYHGAVQRIAEAKVAMPWHVVLLKGIGANWFVCLAVWLAASAKTMFAKMAGCWLPVMAFVALGYEHSIANMFFIPIGMLEGADVTLHQFFIANLLPATIGNIIGGALLVGSAYTYVNR